MSKHVVIAGGSGFLGQALVVHLNGIGYRTTVLTRSSVDRNGFVQWDGATAGAWITHLEGAAAIINLTGRSVDCRYTATNRQEIIQSRVNSIKALSAGLRRCSKPPPVWIQATSLAIYGDAGEMICHDDAPHGVGFSVDVCKTWESELENQHLPDTRIVVLRIGFALAASGGALGRLATLTKLCLGGSVGNGRQYISWLHLNDLNRIFEWCLENQAASGVYNATGPSPVTNKAFMAALRRSLKRPWSPPTPSFAVRLGAFLMGTDASLALTGRRCVPTRLLNEGFRFEYTDLELCLRNIFASQHAMAEI
ncbi:MAG: TIGR01777 family oxidoreductase [Zavarzinella sp.]